MPRQGGAMAVAPAAPIDGGFGAALVVLLLKLEQLAGAPWAPDPPRGRGVSSDVARLE